MLHPFGEPGYFIKYGNDTFLIKWYNRSAVKRITQFLYFFFHWKTPNQYNLLIPCKSPQADWFAAKQTIQNTLKCKE